MSTETDQKNRRLAELLGWTEIYLYEDYQAAPIWVGKAPNRASKQIPDYCRDLNAIHSVEKGLTDARRSDYSSILHKHMAGDFELYAGSSAEFEFLTCDAQARVDALIATLEGES